MAATHPSNAAIARYSLPSFVTSVAALPMALFIPAFYADELGVSLAAVGAAIAASRLLDVVTDPLIGAWSDRLRLPFGRRKTWLVLGTPLFVLALWKVFVPGSDASALSLFGWSALLYLGFTMIDLPHKAWGAEWSSDFDERSRIAGIREAIGTLGQVALLAAVVWLGSEAAAAEQLAPIAAFIALALPACVAVAVLTVPEPPAPESVPAERIVGIASLRVVARNPAFLRMIGCVLFFVSGVAIQGTLHRLVLADVMGDESLFAWMVFIENVATLLAVPLWLALSRRIGKHRALIGAALWIAVLSLPLIVLREGDTMTLMVLIAIRGSSFASILFLANSIAADVIDVDTLETGEPRSGLFFAAWGMVIKLSLALGVLLGTALPAWAGYDPSGSGVPLEIQIRLMAIYGAIPAFLMALGAAFLWGFPITRERHAEIQAELAARRHPSPS